MNNYLEESLKRDIDRIKNALLQMATLAEDALRNSLKSYTDLDRKLAYAVILRDLYIDEKEKEIDRLCLEFFVRQQPISFPVRFAYSTLKINLEVERVGDYAEKIARNVLKLKEKPGEDLKGGIVEIADLSISMFHDAILSFFRQDADLARKTIETENTVDALRHTLNKQLIERLSNQSIGYEMFDPFSAIIKRFERVADQARNICMEVLYMCTGEQVKHPGAEAFRVLFVDDHDRCRGRIAEAIALSLEQSRFIFTSAGLDPEPVDKATAEFMNAKGFDVSRDAPKSIHQIPNIEHYQVLIGLSEEACKLFRQRPRKSVFLDWVVADPSKVSDAEARKKAYEETYRFIEEQVGDLVKAVGGGES
jgi:phosphate transport system protein